MAKFYEILSTEFAAVDSIAAPDLYQNIYYILQNIY